MFQMVWIRVRVRVLKLGTRVLRVRVPSTQAPTLHVVVNFDALAQASDIRIERRQVAFLCWMQDLNPGSQTPHTHTHRHTHTQSGVCTFWGAVPYEEYLGGVSSAYLGGTGSYEERIDSSQDTSSYTLVTWFWHQRNEQHSMHNNMLFARKKHIYMKYRMINTKIMNHGVQDESYCAGTILMMITSVKITEMCGFVHNQMKNQIIGKVMIVCLMSN